MQAFLIVALAQLLPTAHAQDEERWQATLARVVPAVVAIQVTAVRDFDTENASNSVGTGFIVDRERGWILTNRHMVHAGPVIAEATLDNSEEIPLEAIYRDPVHDFGFYRFDPADVKYMELPELTLRPDAVQIGQQIRVVGNDAGEKVSILDGTLARIDRNVPDYGKASYNDFNTFYLQAASNTSGGSSGSPVVNIDGAVIGLNAGGSSRAASSFYLPLDRVVRAFEKLKAGQPIERGTLQATFEHAAYAELGRLGLTEPSERALRALPDANRGGLVVRSLVPKGPADGVLLPGDILLRIAGDPINDFVDLEAKLDDHVGKVLVFSVERGGRALELPITVQDLHSISPDNYLEFGRGVLSPLSYQRARNYNVPVKGVYVSVNGYSLATAGVPEGSVITHIDGQEVPDLDAAEKVLSGLANGQRSIFRFFTIDDPLHPYEAVVVVDRRWFEMRRCTREDVHGDWPCIASPEPPAMPVEQRPSALVLPDAKKPAGRVLPALVRVDFDLPYPTSGVKDVNFVGVGVVVDKSKGLVVVDRDTVPVRLGDLALTFAGAVRVPAEVVFLHPEQNFAFVQYDPGALGEVPVEEVSFRDEILAEGDDVYLVAMDAKQKHVSLATSILTADALELGVSGTPRFRAANTFAYDIKESESSLGGVLTDKKGRVFATWSSFLDQADDVRQFKGLPAQYIVPVLDALRAGRVPEVRVLGAELERLTLDAARDRGLSDARIQALLDDDTDNRMLFEVSRINGLSDAAQHLRSTDIVIAVDGELLTSMAQLANLGPSVSLTVLRDRAERTVSFTPLSVKGSGIERMVSWAGLIVHEPHYEVAAQKGIIPSGVYTTWLWFGSPAARDRVLPTRQIQAINDQPTPDLDAFIAAVKGLDHREPVRVTLDGLDGTRRVDTLKMDTHYWPTTVFEVENGRWVRRAVFGE